jgi:phosphomannomutase
MANKGTLIASISGIRGIFGDGLDPAVLVKYASAYGTWIVRRTKEGGRRPVVVVGRDGRVTGELCARIVASTLQSTGCDVVDAGLATTPTVEMAVLIEQAAGGIILSASHNPAEWNALKLLNERGEFLLPEQGQEVIRIAEAGEARYVSYDRTGSYVQRDFLNVHIERILDLPFIDPAKISARGFKVVVDGINSVGSIAVPALLKRLGVREEDIHLLNGEITGRFAHVAEPLPENLTDTIQYMAQSGADVGIVVDPDADRLALIEDGGTYLSEELTQVVAADFMWRFRKGPFVTNLSSSRAIEDVAKRYGAAVYRSAVGEINVVQKMQEVGAMLGGEGNGGVILPDLHYGRDAMVGVAIVLQHLANEGTSLSELRKSLPVYKIVKQKTPVGNLNPDALLTGLAQKYAREKLSTEDGLKIDLEEGWVHLRKSNTEPIIRVYSEAQDEKAAQRLGERFMSELQEMAALR